MGCYSAHDVWIPSDGMTMMTINQGVYIVPILMTNPHHKIPIDAYLPSGNLTQLLNITFLMCKSAITGNFQQFCQFTRGYIPFRIPIVLTIPIELDGTSMARGTFVAPLECLWCWFIQAVMSRSGLPGDDSFAQRYLSTRISFGQWYFSGLTWMCTPRKAHQQIPQL